MPNQNKNLKDNFVKNIENKINEIKSNNIGQDEVTVSVYENNKKTVRTLITTKDYQLCYDFISNENIYSQFSYTDTQEEKEQSKKVTLNKKENKIDLNYEEIEDESEKNISFEKNENQNNNESNKDTLIKYEDSKNKVEMKINEKNKIVNKFENEISFKDDNSVKLNQLDENDLQEIVNKVDKALNDKIEILEEEINDDEVNSLEVIETIRNEYKMYFSFIVIIDKNGTLSYEAIKKENSFMIDLLKEEEICRLKYDVRYIYNSTLTRKKILTVIFDSQIYNLPYEDILYIEKERNSKRSIIHTKTDIVYTTKTLTDLEDLLDERFFRTHQSAIVNLDNVKMIDPSKNYLLFIGDEKCFYLSRDKKKKLKELCDEQGLISTK